MDELYSVPLRELLLEVERRGLRVIEEGYYSTIGMDLAIGARNILDLLPGSVLESTRAGEKRD